VARPMEKLDFLLDENVLVKPARSFDEPAAELWLKIHRRCHRVVLSPEHSQRFWQWLRRLRSRLDTHPIPTFLETVSICLTHSGKSTWVTEENVPEEACIRHQKDKFLARLAVRCPGCVVVTADKNTREDFQRPEFMEKRGIRAVTIQEALSLAKGSV